MKISNERAIAATCLATATVTSAITYLALRHLNRYPHLQRPLAAGGGVAALATLTVALWPARKKVEKGPTQHKAYITTNADAALVPARDAWHPDWQHCRIRDVGGQVPAVKEGEGWVMVGLSDKSASSHTVLLPASWIGEMADGDEMELAIDGKVEIKKVNWLLTDADYRLIPIMPDDLWISVEKHDGLMQRLPASLFNEGPAVFHMGQTEYRFTLDQSANSYGWASSTKQALDQCRAVARQYHPTGLHQRLSADAVRLPFKSDRTLGAPEPFWPWVDDGQAPDLLKPYVRAVVEVPNNNGRQYVFPDESHCTVVVDAAGTIDMERDCHLIRDGKRLYFAIYRPTNPPAGDRIVQSTIPEKLYYGFTELNALPEQITSTAWGRKDGRLKVVLTGPTK